MVHPLNVALADALAEVALLSELHGENPFKARAFRNAARVFESLDEPAADLLASGALARTKGIGKGILGSVTEFLEQGAITAALELRAAIPKVAFEMLALPDLGPAKVRSLIQGLALESLSDLEAAATAGRVQELPGFGARTEARILEGLRFRRAQQGHRRLGDVLQSARDLETRLGHLPGVERVAVVGSVRRFRETVRDLDLLVVALDRDRAQQQIRDALADLGAAVDPAPGPVVRGRLENGVPVEVGAVSPEAFPAALVVTTGSAAHREGLTARATARSMTLTTEGLAQDGRIVRCEDEAAVYAALDLPWMAPELREGQGEIEAAEQGRLPVLVEPSDILGCFHVHSTWSDGKNSLEEIARHAATIGLRYVGIADHSRSAAYAGGLSIDQLQEQGRAIDQINAASLGTRLLKGVESDILTDGRLDYPDRVLAELDFVVGSIHSGLKMDQDTATARMLKALQNPRLSILGHPTGRLLLDREGYSLDWGPVLAAAARHQKILEINAHPSRLDLDWRQVRPALAAGVKLAVNPDAHDLAGFDYLPLGVAMARKGWATATDVVNTQPEPWKSFA